MPYRPYSGCDEIKEIKVICQGKQGEKQLQLIVHHARSFDRFERFPYWITSLLTEGAVEVFVDCEENTLAIEATLTNTGSTLLSCYGATATSIGFQVDILPGQSLPVSRPLWIIDGGDKKSADNLKQRNQSTLTSKKSPRNLTTVRSLGPDTTDACKLIMILTHLPLRVPMARSLPSQTNSQPALSSLEWDSAQTPVICLELLLLPALKKCRLCPSVCLV